MHLIAVCFDQLEITRQVWSLFSNSLKCLSEGTLIRYDSQNDHCQLNSKHPSVDRDSVQCQLSIKLNQEDCIDAAIILWIVCHLCIFTPDHFTSRRHQSKLTHIHLKSQIQKRYAWVG